MERFEAATARIASSWLLEIGAAILSAGSLAALVGVLIGASGQSVLKWQWENVTLNAIVSVLSTISRLSALYVLSSSIGQTKWILFSRGPESLLDFEALDVASRGFVGCAQLLPRARKIVVIGAIAVLVALAFDPFAQQLVQIHSEVAYEPSTNATMPVAKRYDAGSLNFALATQNEDGFQAVDAKTDFGMQSAVLNGLTQQKSAIDKQMPLQCSSGNCTWASVQSLAVCSTCNDVTSSLRRWTNDEPTVPWLSSNNFGTVFGDSTTYSLGSNVFLNNLDGNSSLSQQYVLSMTAHGGGDPESTTTLRTIDTLIWSSAIIQASLDETAHIRWPDDFIVSATECGLYYCVKEYNVTVTTNEVVETSNEVESAGRAPQSWQSMDAVDQRKFSESTSDSQTLVDPLIPFGPRRTDLMLGDNFNISQSAIISLSYFMNTTFTRADAQPYNSSFPADSSTLGGFYISNLTNAASQRTDAEYEPGVMQALHDSEDLSATFAALAASMSNAMRAHRSSDTVATGELGQRVARYRIAWPWIALPAVVVVASLVQLVVTILKNGESPMWKSSTLATLSRGQHAQGILSGAATLCEFRIAAGQRDIDLFGERSGRWSGQMGLDGQDMELREGPKHGTSMQSIERDDSQDSLLRRREYVVPPAGSSRG